VNAADALAVLRAHFEKHGDLDDLEFDDWVELSLDHVDVDDLRSNRDALDPVDEAWLVLATADEEG